MIPGIIFNLVKGILSLRYNVKITGLEEVKDLKTKTLILPNHPSLIEPIIIATYMIPFFNARPVLFRENFNNPVFMPIMKQLRAIEVPSTFNMSVSAHDEAHKVIEEVISCLKNGQNIIMWPAGRIYRTNHENLGAASALTEILNAVPDINIVIIKTRGMWGSMFSLAQTAIDPPIVEKLKKGFFTLLQNLIFFTPRRNINVTVEKIDKDLIPKPYIKEKINPYFNSLYNSEGPERPVYVPYHFLFGPRTYDFPDLSAHENIDLSKVKEDKIKAVKEIIEIKLKRMLSPDEMKSEAKLEDMGIDSLSRMEITLEIEQRFGFISSIQPANFGQLVALANGTLVQGKLKPKTAPEEWFKPAVTKYRLKVLADNIPEAFLNRTLSNPDDTVCADDLRGVLTYSKMLIAVYTIAKHIKKIEGKNIGLMLPASSGVSMVFLAIHFAGKIPVMLNWTTGPAYLEHSAKILNVKHVITSRNFIDRLGIEVKGTEYLYLEELIKKINKSEFIGSAIKINFFRNSFIKSFITPKPDDYAVILFTSGSEKAPKAVPLTHKNILSNITSALEAFQFTNEDSLIGFLPPFHSFGLTASILMPLLSGMKVVFHIDPTDSSALVLKIKNYKPAVLFSTPTFLSYIIDRCEPGDFNSVNLAVTGAEKCPKLLMKKIRELSPKTYILEGYGITECSPIISVNRREKLKIGSIGLPLNGVDAMVVDIETFQPLIRGHLGMLLVSGPNVFNGYIAYDGESPFREINGKKYYITGDLATIDLDGFIFFSGRLKRFIKVGGEMISLPALEEPFTQIYPPAEKGPQVAVEGIERFNDKKIVLFSTFDITTAQANEILQKAGFKGIMRIDEVIKLKAIPVLGTGKTDYKVLRKMIE